MDGLNNAGCPLGGTSATTESTCLTPLKASSTSAEESDAVQFSVSPVPFRESLNVLYNFDYVSDATIQMYDMQGKLLSTHIEANASKGKITNLSINFRTLPKSDIYYQGYYRQGCVY